jgi:ATP adenylyltransferase
MAFIQGKKPDKCVFCSIAQDTTQDNENFVLWRGKTCFAILNRYPYTTGHLMVIPYRHTNDFTSLSKDESCELFDTTKKLTGVLSETLKPDGFNIGMNLGKVAGAGIADHLHVHIVPRWDGDNNFMPVIGKVKVHPTSLQEVFEIIKSKISF